MPKYSGITLFAVNETWLRHRLDAMKVVWLSWICLLASALALSATATGNAQNTPSVAAPPPESVATQPPPLCNPASLDATFTFANIPAGEQTVSLHFQNQGSTACRIEGQAGASFAVDGHSMAIENCWLCDQHDRPLPYPERQTIDQALLAPGERAAVDLHWATTGSSCQWADWADFVVQWALPPTGYLFIPSGWPLRICSSVRSSGYRLGAGLPSIATVIDGALRISVLPNPVYSDERATLHIERTDQTAPAGETTGCANLYTVRHGPEIGTRLDPLTTKVSYPIASFTPEQIREDQERAWPSWKRDRMRTCDVGAGWTIVDAEISASDLAQVTHIEWRTALAQPTFLTAATKFTVLGVDTLPPNWGESAAGIRAGLSVDHPTFIEGEKIPLHLRWENVDATEPLGQGECAEPRPILEIQDFEHNVLRTIPMEPMCMGHGWGPFGIDHGKPQRAFYELTTTELPHPGVYYLVSVWSPHVLYGEAEPSRRRAGKFGGVYSTARSLRVRVEIVAKRNP